MEKTMRLIMVLGALVALLAIAQIAAARTVKIAVVRDGPSGDAELVDDIEAELRRLVDDDVTVVFDRSERFDASWGPGRATAVVREALNSDADLILGAGSGVSLAAAAPDVPLTKPFVSTFVFYPDIEGLPVTDGAVTKPGFNTMVFDRNASEDLDELRALVPFDTAYVGFSNVADMGDRIVSYGRSIGVEMVPMNFRDDMEATMAALPDHAQAFVLVSMQRISEEQRRRIIEAVDERKVPCFSLVGRRDVELGALASPLPDFRKQRVRRIALNLSRLIRGEPVESLPVILAVERRLLINGRTAAEIGYEPSLRVRNTAEFIDEAALSRATLLTFVEALDTAEKNNISLAIKNAEVETALRQKQRARSPMLPQVVTGAAWQENHPTIDTPLLPENLSVGTVQVNQMIYDDRVVTNFRSAGRFHESAEYEREAERLNVLADAGNAFLSFALSGVLRRVSADNVRLTEDNLELSRTRFAAGYSGRDEVLRWESILASRRSELLRRDANMETARIALNQVLGVDQSMTWEPEAMSVDIDGRDFWLGELSPMGGNPEELRRLTEVFVQVAVDSAPELKALDVAADAYAILAAERGRSFLLPSFVASLSYDYFFNRSPDPPPGARDDDYSFQIAAIYPLFTGGDKYYSRKLQQSQRDAVLSQREFVRQRIEQRARSAMQNLAASHPIIGLNRSAADNARRNLEIVQDQYTQGVVNVTDLLSAQNDQFTAEQNAEASVYGFLLDLVELQRVLTYFEVEKTQVEREAFYSYVRQAVGE